MRSNPFTSIIVQSVMPDMRVMHVIHVMSPSPPVNFALAVMRFMRVMYVIRFVGFGLLSSNHHCSEWYVCYAC